MDPLPTGDPVRFGAQLDPVEVVRDFLRRLDDGNGPDELPPAAVTALGLALRDSAARTLFVQGIASEAEAFDGLSSFGRSRLAQLRTVRVSGYRVFARPQVEHLRELDDLRRSFAASRASASDNSYWVRRWKRWLRRPRRNRFIGFVTVIGTPRR